MKKILLTGVTGFVGSNICSALLQQEENIIYLLTRSRGKLKAQERVRQVLAKTQNIDLDEYKGRIKVLDGNIEEEKLGLKEEEYRELCEEITVIYHSAASIKFDLSYEDAKRINYMGTKHILELVSDIENKDFDRLNYVSTAYIAGTHFKGFKEEDLEVGQEFLNTYEMTKYESEKLLQEYIKKGYPITIYRPSIVSSNSKTGATHKNNIIYKFIKLLNYEKIEDFYCDENSSINIVPVDYFVEGMLYLAERKDTYGKTFNLVNHKNVPIRDCVKYACDNLKVKLPNFVTFSKEIEAVIEKNPLKYFYEYVKASHEFDDEETRNTLVPEKIICSRITEEYIEKNITYCREFGLL